MRRLAWLAGVLLLLAIASAPFWLQLPQPEGALQLQRARLLEGPGAPGEVQLPHRWQQRGGRISYQLEFELEQPPREPLYLFIPMLAQRAVLAFEGRQILDTGNRARQTGVASGQPALVALPTSRLTPGRHQVTVQVEALGGMPGHLSQVWLGTAEQLRPHYRLRLFLLEQLRLMVLAAQVLITIAVALACLFRPREPLFAWMAGALALTLSSYVGLFADLHPLLAQLLPHSVLLVLAGNLMVVVLALLVSGLPAPRWLRWAPLALPLACLVAGWAGPLTMRAVALLVGVPVSILAVLVAACITAWGAWRQQATEAQLLVLPLALQALAGLYDGLVVGGWLPGPVLLSVYCRPLLSIAVAVLLMRRLGLSLRRLDEANAHLTERLAERERELARLYEAERQEAAQRVRDEERRRLTVDLHDGVGGHLASIIALAEREGTGSIERAAREALDDLRVVIHSLDIGDRELPLALAGWRERLARQLKRLGIELDWSIAQLPEIAGVTPGQALNVLRILQEAVTNAHKHGPATWIRIRGEPHGPGFARIVVENDGAPFAWGAGGNGLANMRRRAEQLAGSVTVEPGAAGGTRVQLVIPEVLPPAPGARW